MLYKEWIVGLGKKRNTYQYLEKLIDQQILG